MSNTIEMMKVPVLFSVGCVPLCLPGVVELALVRSRFRVATAAAWVGLPLKRIELESVGYSLNLCSGLYYKHIMIINC